NIDHYATFQSVYGIETTEEHRLTYMQSQANVESIPKSILVVGKIRDYIYCEDCGKRRCVYSDKSLTYEEQEDYQQALNSYSYSCGAPIFPDDHYLKEVVFVQREDLVTPPQSLKERFKQIYPLCEGCQENGKEFYTKGEIKTNRHSIKRHKHK
ncbi:8684_t:CDS:2, partial [Funneliformis caledonium]